MDKKKSSPPKTDTETQVKKDDPMFTKEQILKSKKFKNSKDILNIILEGEKYTLDEVEKKIKAFKERKVK